MKAHFNHIGSLNAVGALALLILLLNFASSVKADTLQTTSAYPTAVALPGGVTDLEIQRALDALPATGGTVILPPGEILVRQPIVLHRDFQTLRGSVSGTTLRLADNANCPVVVMGEAVNHPSKMLKNLCVRDVYIDGNRIHQQRELWHVNGEGSDIRNNGITIQSVSNSTVEHVTCARCRSGGLVTTLGVRHLTVTELNSFDNQFDGLACYQTENSWFTELNLHDNPGAGISLDLAFNHNVISNAVLAANDLGIFMRSSQDNKFHNISIHDCRHHGVFMAQEVEATSKGWDGVPRSECTHNAFTNLAADNCGSAAFRVNDTTCTNNVLIQANFKGNSKGGISQVQPSLVIVE